MIQFYPDTPITRPIPEPFQKKDKIRRCSPPINPSKLSLSSSTPTKKQGKDYSHNSSFGSLQTNMIKCNENDCDKATIKLLQQQPETQNKKARQKKKSWCFIS